MAEPFDRPASARSVEIEIKNSRFICHVAPTAGIEAAQAFVGRIRREHPDANHNCWCYVAGDPQDYNQWNCSDDGEPRGTAGKPMLNVLTHSGLGEICVVVTRYFGGIKLGAGGLVRAYSQAVQTGLDHLPTEAVIETFAVSLSAPHALTGPLEQILRQLGLEVLERHWGERLEIRLQPDQDQLEALRARLAPLDDVAIEDDSGPV